MSQAKTVKQFATSSALIQATKIIAIGDNFVTFERKKPHTSKVQEETVTVGGDRSLLAVYGIVGEAGTVAISAKAQSYHDSGEIEVTANYVEVKNEYPTRFFVQPGASLEITSDAYDVEGAAPAAE